MKVLITGATGLIGKEIVRLYREAGIDVHYLTTRKAKIVVKNGYKGFLWNPAANEIDFNCFEGVTAIINLAGAPISNRWTKTYKKKILSSRIDSLQTLAKGLAHADVHKIETIVCASAIGIYPSSLSNFYTEDSEQRDTSFLCQVTKAWENEVNVFERFNIKLAHIRIGLVLSNKGGALVEIARPIKFGLGAAFGKGQQWQSWIHSTDLARIFIYVVTHKLEGVYNGVAPNPITNSKLVKETAEALNRPLILPNIPKFVMKGILGEMAALVFASQRVSSKKIESEGFEFLYPNINSALGDIYSKKPH